MSNVPIAAINLDDIRWTKQANGVEAGRLVGNRATGSGLYMQFVRWPPNMINKAHSHPDDRYAVVVQGRFYHGFGDKFDAGKLEERPTARSSRSRRA